jgi:hypothetical protein
MREVLSALPSARKVGGWFVLVGVTVGLVLLVQYCTR